MQERVSRIETMLQSMPRLIDSAVSKQLLAFKNDIRQQMETFRPRDVKMWMLINEIDHIQHLSV